MADKDLIISRLISGGLITNYYCTSACRHCLYRSGPMWSREYMKKETALENLAKIRDLGCRYIHIGGGEPFHDIPGLCSILDAAEESGVSVEYVETNSSWYRDHGSATRTLEILALHGLKTLLVSISPFHNEHIPFCKVTGVIKACREAGLMVMPWVAEFIRDITVFDVNCSHGLSEYIDYFGKGYVQDILRRYWISPGGRALDTFGRYVENRPLAELVENSRGGCHELEGVDHFHLDLYGNYIPGLCSGLSIDREDLGGLVDEDKYPIITRLYGEGLGGLLSYAAENFGYRPGRMEYFSKCEACYEIRQFIFLMSKRSSPELRPEGHYTFG